MNDDADWRAATWEGSRLRQHREFLALPLREKLAIIEQLGDVAAAFGGPGRVSKPGGGNWVTPRP